MRIVPGIEQPQVGEALPGVARHLVEQAFLHVHHFVVRQRQHEVLGPRVHLAEGQLVVLILAVDRLFLDVVETVVHPAHVPLHRKAQPAEFDRSRHGRPRGRFLGDGEHAGEAAVHFGVHFAQEMDRLEILAPAILVGQPFARIARVVEVEHRGDGVDAQAVDVELVQPVQRVGDQKVAHLVAAEVEHQRAPFLVLATARIGMLVHRLAGEARQRPVVFRKVRRHPVEQHADVGLMAGVDKGAEIVGRAEARSRCVIARHLVAPRGVERMLGHRQQFDVGVAEILYIGNQFGDEFIPGIKTAVGMAPPGTGMQLVDADRAMLPVEVRAGVDPAAVLPGIGRVVGHATGGLRTHEHLPCVGIGFFHQLATAAEDFVFVDLAGSQAGDEQFPDAGGAAAAHRVAAAIPVVEIADHADALHRRCPHGKQATRHAIDGFQARAEHLPGFEMAPLADQIQVHFAQLRTQSCKGIAWYASHPPPCPASAGSDADRPPFQAAAAARNSRCRSPASCGRRPLRPLRQRAERRGSGCCHRVGHAAPAPRTDHDARRSARA